jgi:hypothetical protein
VIIDLPSVLLRTIPRFARIHTLEDTESSKVLEADGELFEHLGSSDEDCVGTAEAAFLLFAVAREFAVGCHAGMDGGFDGFGLGAAFDAVSHGWRWWWLDEMSAVEMLEVSRCSL